MYFNDWKIESYTVAARPVTQEELDGPVFCETEKDVRVWFEDPRGWTLPEFIGFHVSKAQFRFQLTPEQAQHLRDLLRKYFRSDIKIGEVVAFEGTFHGLGTTDDGNDYQMGHTEGDYDPLIQNPKTGKTYVLHWDDIVRLAQQAGIDKP